MNWFSGWHEIWESILHGINIGLVATTKYVFGLMLEVFNFSISALKDEVAITPTQFDPNLLSRLRTLSETVVLPIAILLITYVFVLQIIEYVSDKNKGYDFDVGKVIFLIIKTFIMISLATNAFTIALGFSDLSTWMIEKVPSQDIEISDDITSSIVDSIKPIVVDETGKKVDDVTFEDFKKEGNKEKYANYKIDYRIGIGTITVLFSFVSVIFVCIISAIIYLVAWSRIILIFLYVTIAPIPMATVMSETWVNSIGQNYLKNLMALTIQGFLMLVLLIIYNGLLARTSILISTGQGGFKGLLLMIVSMAIIAKMLIGTHNFAKSITGAS